jgi:NAD(P)-dependent dehydrogenase (short-subunit alcohol dehydrogenase family)
MGRTASKLDALCEKLVEEGASAGGSAASIVGDCTLADDVRLAFDTIQARTGAPPRAVVYNAGNAAMGSLRDMQDDFFEAAWRICAFGAFLCGREAARRMVPAGGGSLLFTGATSSLRAKPPFTAFASAKAAERAVAQGLAREFGPEGLHVAHVIVDGMIDGAQIKSRLPDIGQRMGEDGMLSPDAIADAYWHLHTQHRSAWTFELDLRPFKETW